VLQRRKRSLRVGKVARLQRLPNRLKGLGPARVGEGLGIAVGSVLSDCREITKGLLGSTQVATSERARQLLQVGAAALIEILDFLEDRAGNRR
jgi:hypothetical protein